MRTTETLEKRGSRNKKRFVSMTEFTWMGGARGVSYVQNHFEGHLTKKEMLKKVGQWWDGYGTSLCDYEGIQVMLPSEKEGDDD